MATKRERSDMKLAPFALTVAGLLAGCGSTMPTAPPASAPAASPAAQVDPSAPANVQAPPSSGEPATPPASAAPAPTPTPDPDAVRKVAAAQYLSAAVAADRAAQAIHNDPKAGAEVYGQFAADLTKLQVPADTAADLRDLIRKVNRLQALSLEESGHFDKMADFYVVLRHLRNTRSRYDRAVDRVRSDLDLPALCRAGCSVPGPIF